MKPKLIKVSDVYALILDLKFDLEVLGFHTEDDVSGAETVELMAAYFARIENLMGPDSHPRKLVSDPFRIATRADVARENGD